MYAETFVKCSNMFYFVQTSIVNDLTTHWCTVLENVTLLIPADSTPSVHVEAIARLVFFALTASPAEVDGGLVIQALKCLVFFSNAAYANYYQ